MNHTTTGLIELGDVEALVEHVGSLCLDERWGDIVTLRDGCLAAATRGKQLWPAASYAEYRLALDAPARFGMAIVDSNLERFALGPFTEVLASTHEWGEIAPHAALASAPALAALAQERVIRGEDLRRDPCALACADVFELPLVVEPWEPRYPLARYLPAGVEHEAPGLVAVHMVDLPSKPQARLDGAEDTAVCDALLDLVGGWTRGSNGRADAVAIHGGQLAAIRTLGAPHARIDEREPGDAMLRMAWAAASGGAHGRRRGAATGRSLAWWAVLQLTGLADPGNGSPVSAVAGEAVGAAMAELRWAVWDDGAPDTGWALRLAVEDPSDGLAWALTAVDAD